MKEKEYDEDGDEIVPVIWSGKLFLPMTILAVIRLNWESPAGVLGGSYNYILNHPIDMIGIIITCLAIEVCCRKAYHYINDKV